MQAAPERREGLLLWPIQANEVFFLYQQKWIGRVYWNEKEVAQKAL